jgi:CDP-diacylglycerol--glycerol-3-phosphate 3-phosphatidyltransferase
MMVSYVRARAEGLQIECKGGLMQRPERVVTIGVSGLICGVVSAITGGNHKLFLSFLSFDVIETISIFTIPIIIVAILSNITAVKRLNHCRRFLNEEKTLVK